MLRKLPGIDIPEANVHHAAAFLEFKWQVEMLAKEGQDLAAYTCWTHAIEARHSLLSAPLPVNLNCSSFGQMPCCKRNCQSCAAQLGRFKFPGWGCGTPVASSFRPMFSLGTRGHTTISAWEDGPPSCGSLRESAWQLLKSM